MQGKKKEGATMSCHVAVSDAITMPVRHQVQLEAQLRPPVRKYMTAWAL